MARAAHSVATPIALFEEKNVLKKMQENYFCVDKNTKNKRLTIGRLPNLCRLDRSIGLLGHPMWRFGVRPKPFLNQRFERHQRSQGFTLGPGLALDALFEDMVLFLCCGCFLAEVFLIFVWFF